MAWKSRIFQIEHQNKNGMKDICFWNSISMDKFDQVTQSTFICRDFYSKNIPNIEVLVKVARDNML